MKIICSNSVVFAQEAFSTLGDVRCLAPREISPADVRDAVALVTRSTTRIDGALLESSSVRFVGTATIGTDHMDIPYLDQKGIAWTAAPGCNANSVAEYVISALLCLADRHGFALKGKTFGIIGVGNVGSRVMALAQVLGLKVLLNDPPRERSEGARSGLSFVPIEEVLEHSDILTLHTPLTRDGTDPTHHLANASFFRSVKEGCIFVNAARGEIVETRALLDAIAQGIIAHTVIDTWEHEPAYSPDLLAQVDLGTPHIAGYSFDGLVNGTARIYKETCAHFNLAPSWSPESLGPTSQCGHIDVSTGTGNKEVLLWQAVQQAYNVETDDRALRAGCSEDAAERGQAFDELRKRYAVRREFRASTVRLKDTNLAETLRGLGFETAVPDSES